MADTIRRQAVEAACPACSRGNTLLLPEGCCGNEFVWHARCRGCGAWRWFHSREDRLFVRAIRETAGRRDEPEGLSPEGTREAHAAYESTLDPCGCGGRYQVVMDMRDVPCLGCGRALRQARLPIDRARPVDVPPLRIR
jgi:hypothetical protein